MNYNEHLSYDQNGNITTLTRNGDLDSDTSVIAIDNLIYNYDAMYRLQKVVDFTGNPSGFKEGADNEDEYGYDKFGNMIRDDNKDITSITYNHLNLPKEITFDGTPTRKINYLYNATGQKVAKKITNNSTETMTDYQGIFHYVNQRLMFFATSEGYVNIRSNSKTGVRRFSYVYNYTDHLGNIRLSYTKGTGENPPVILEENHYYPFGLKHKKYGSVDKDLVCIDEDCYEVGIDVVPPQARKSYQMKMQSKEFQDELGLNVHDFHFRQYMQDLGRTTSLDPYAENYYSLSPYSFLGNNPLVFADPDGKDYGVYIDHEKNTINIKSHYIDRKSVV